MIKIENVEIYGWKAAIRGMRNPKNSWEMSDSALCPSSDRFEDCHVLTLEGCPRADDDFSYDCFCVGAADLKLMKTLSNAGPDHGKFMRMITVTLDIVAPLYWWKEYDTYKIGTVADSCSTMHKIQAKEFTLDDFSHEHLNPILALPALENTIYALNFYRIKFLVSKEKDNWWQMIQLLPTSYNQRRTVQLNYQVLKNMYNARKNHKLDEWCDFCKWIESLPYAELITEK